VLPHGRSFWIEAGALCTAALLLDAPLRRAAVSHQSGTANRVADAVDPLGRAQYLVPSLVIVVVVPRVAGNRRLSDAALRVALGYAAADLLGGGVRTIVARHRPDSTGDPWRFRPFRPQGEWGSTPSAHATHAFAIAAGIAEASGKPWAARVAYGLASLVAVQRVYTQAHWASDVVVAAALGTAVSRRVVDVHF
jgi:membrane-associated phospholipid phosphatase